MEDALNFDDASVGINASIRRFDAGSDRSSYGGTSFGDVTINVNGARYEDERKLAIAISEVMQDLTDRRVAIYA